ncbi:MAG: cellulase family glycosylhydrolase [Anaerolineae bacterium]
MRIQSWLVGAALTAFLLLLPAAHSISADSSLRQEQNPPAPTPGFTVRNSTIYDPNGREFVANGVNVNGFNWVWQRSTVGDVDLIVDCWNFNLIRVNSFLFTGQIQYPQFTDNNDLDAIISTYTSRGIVVVLEAHDRIGSYYQGADLDVLVNWFTDLAARYRDNPYVWFDVMNEPGGRDGIDRDQWVNMHGRVIEAIRGTGAQNIIIVEGAYGGQDSPDDSAILRYASDILNYNGQQYENIVFSIHPYDLWAGGSGILSSFLDHARAQELTILIGEYAIYTDQDTRRATEAVFGSVLEREIGRVVWHWDGSDYNKLTENTTRGGGWEINDCVNPTNLSWLGQQVWAANH